MHVISRKVEKITIVIILFYLSRMANFEAQEAYIERELKYLEDNQWRFIKVNMSKADQTALLVSTMDAVSWLTKGRLRNSFCW